MIIVKRGKLGHNTNIMTNNLIEIFIKLVHAGQSP